ncbi:MAG: EVE domain-containing protein [Legionellales bacterium]|nr:EVE domain-containing protein [Legionellales bacterium]
MTHYWLMKSEPSCFSIDELRQRPEQIAPWDGVRNYQARNFMKNDMAVGDQAFFYHSSCNPPGIVGIMEIISEAYPDDTAFDPTSDHPDANSTPENPRWFMVDVRLVKKFKEKITLETLKNQPELSQMPLLRRGNRLSITPVTAQEWGVILNYSSKTSS